jgi:hypothetical protein
MKITTVNNKLYFNGVIDVSRNGSAPMELQIIVNKCDQDMKKCEKLPPRSFKQLCATLNDKSSFLYTLITKLDPPMECPVKAQQYIANNAVVDITPLTFLPMNGFVWIAVIKIFSGENREMTLCLEASFRNNKIALRRRRPK